MSLFIFFLSRRTLHQLHGKSEAAVSIAINAKLQACTQQWLGNAQDFLSKEFKNKAAWTAQALTCEIASPQIP